jgi:hypothetical protein
VTTGCTNLGSFSITLPAGTPAGLLLVTGKHQVNIGHTTGTTDYGYLAWVPNAAAACPSADTQRSYFRVVAGEPTATGNPAYVQTLFTTAAFTVPAGGGTFTLFLAGQMLSGATSDDQEGNDFVNIEFHTL